METTDIQLFIDNQQELNLMVTDLFNLILNSTFAIITLGMIILFVIPFLIFKN